MILEPAWPNLSVMWILPLNTTSKNTLGNHCTNMLDLKFCSPFPSLKKEWTFLKKKIKNLFYPSRYISEKQCPIVSEITKRKSWGPLVILIGDTELFTQLISKLGLLSKITCKESMSVRIMPIHANYLCPWYLDLQNSPLTNLINLKRLYSLLDLLFNSEIFESCSVVVLRST